MEGKWKIDCSISYLVGETEYVREIPQFEFDAGYHNFAHNYHAALTALDTVDPFLRREKAYITVTDPDGEVELFEM